MGPGVGWVGVAQTQTRARAQAQGRGGVAQGPGQGRGRGAGPPPLCQESQGARCDSHLKRAGAHELAVRVGDLIARVD